MDLEEVKSQVIDQVEKTVQPVDEVVEKANEVGTLFSSYPIMQYGGLKMVGSVNRWGGVLLLLLQELLKVSAGRADGTEDEEVEKSKEVR